MIFMEVAHCKESFILSLLNQSQITERKKQFQRINKIFTYVLSSVCGFFQKFSFFSPYKIEIHTRKDKETLFCGKFFFFFWFLFLFFFLIKSRDQCIFLFSHQWQFFRSPKKFKIIQRIFQVFFFSDCLFRKFSSNHEKFSKKKNLVWIKNSLTLQSAIEKYTKNRNFPK